MLKDFLVNLAASAVYDFAKWPASIVSKSEVAQTILKDLGMSPTHHDFEQRYIETLVELRSQGKDRIVLDFFREEGIAQVFYDFYYGEQRGNQRAFAAAHDTQIKALRVGDEVKEAGVDEASEVNQFWVVFRQKVAETRSVKEAEQFQEVQMIRQQIQGRHQSTGQILSLEHFKASSERSIYAFPITLQNTFLRRENELATLLQNLEDNPINIVSGRAGVGKTKLCLEAMGQFLTSNPGFEAYCIRPNVSGDSIFHDLQVRLQSGKKYLLFLDDANRQLPNVRSVLSAMESHLDSEIRVLFTVRDYADQEVKAALGKFKFASRSIEPLSEDAILEILKSPDFNIQNSDYQSRILRIAKGNTRIAIMLAKLAVDAQRLEVLNNVSDVYEHYFQQIRHDKVDLTDADVLRTFGLIALFQSIDTARAEHFSSLLANFGMDEARFRAAAEILDSIELVVVSADRRFLRIDEQTMGGYIFHKVFIAEKLLPFSTVLEHHFDEHWRQIKEGIITAANDFDFETVEKSIAPDLKKAWESLCEGDERIAIKFLEVFWFFLREETLAFITEQVEALPKVDAPIFQTEPRKEPAFSKDGWLINLLGNFFYSNERELKTALSTGFHYVARAPHSMPDWVKVLREKLAPSRHDQHNGFYRQKIFLDWMLANSDARKPEYLAAFFALIPDLLKTIRSVSEQGITRDSISFYEFQLPDIAEVRDFRRSIWQFLERSFSDLPHECFQVLIKYPVFDYRPVRSLLESDLPQVLAIWGKFCSPDEFLPCFYLRRFVDAFKNIGLATPELLALT